MMVTGGLGRSAEIGVYRYCRLTPSLSRRTVADDGSWCLRIKLHRGPQTGAADGAERADARPINT